MLCCSRVDDLIIFDPVYGEDMGPWYFVNAAFLSLTAVSNKATISSFAGQETIPMILEINLYLNVMLD